MPRYINADELLAEAKRLSGPQTGDGWDNWGVYALIERQPTANVVERKKGKWVEECPDCLDGDSVYVCSVCGETWTLIEGTPKDNNMNYCPNCGAEMEADNG